MIKSGVVAIKKISKNENVAYMLTKALSYEKFNYCLPLLNITNSK